MESVLQSICTNMKYFLFALVVYATFVLMIIHMA